MNWVALISAIFTIGSMASIASGNPALGAVLSDPHTAVAATAVVGGVGAIVSAFSPSVARAVKLTSGA